MRHRRLLSVALYSGFFLQPRCFAQQLPDKNILDRQTLQAEARQIFAAEMTREQAGDCPSAQTTVDFNTCFADRLTLAGQSLKRYEEIIRDLTDPSPRAENPAQENPQAITGSVLTPQQHLAEFDRVEQAWRQYTSTACKAAFHQFEGGSGGPSFEEQCELKLTRNHIRELDMIYGEDLHL
jgi:uncharacterized protein YecT (DUF1311 family)